ncbi:MAG: 16S rRNA (uracil(1498)-N(3))-methyltransferase [Bacteroidales bacterium]|nr:16S rRNA (uracil(1498)-N(3))-methyltransferase [Bacteroidales bacterium]
MNLFYTPQLQKPQFKLDEEESKHLIRVLRKQIGDVITTTDGKGKFYECEIIVGNAKGCMVEVKSERNGDDTRNFLIHLAVAPTKNINRFEWFLEKATEMGVDSLTPIITFHSERRDVKPDRLEKVLVAAMKQSLKSQLPELHDAVKFNQFIQKPFDGDKFIAFIDREVTRELASLCKPNKNTLVLIGPEGDFSHEEVEAAKQQGFIPVKLGPARLRTETAGVAACHTIHVINLLNT